MTENWEFRSPFRIAIVITALRFIPPCVAASTVVVHPGMNIQNLVDASPSGTNYLIQPGIHRLQTIKAKDGDIFQGVPGAVLNGSMIVTGFVRERSFWAASVTVPKLPRGTVPCLSGGNECQYPEDLFLDEVTLPRVERLDQVTRGKWYLDYAAHKVYTSDNPAGRKVELSIVPSAFSGGKDVTVRGLLLEKYANAAQQGAIGDIGEGWIIEDNEIRLNHGTGIKVNSWAVVRSNDIHHNGQLGIGGDGSDIIIENNQVAYNNTMGFDYMGSRGEAGGIKVVNSTRLLIRANYVHHNRGPGIWLDKDNFEWLVEGNRLYANKRVGILDEISYDGVIRYNLLENEGYSDNPFQTSLWWRAAILIHSSRSAEVFGNTLIRCGNGIGLISNDRGAGNRGEHVVMNAHVYDNTILQTEGIAAGAVADSAPYYFNVYRLWNNHFRGNRYKLRPASEPVFTWYEGGENYANINSQSWQRLGQDQDGMWLSPFDQTVPSRKFSSGDRIRVTQPGRVYSMPTSEAGLVGVTSAGDEGTITSVTGPIYSSGECWWHVKYDSGTQGWSAASGLASTP